MTLDSVFQAATLPKEKATGYTEHLKGGLSKPRYAISAKYTRFQRYSTKIFQYLLVLIGWQSNNILNI